MKKVNGGILLLLLLSGFVFASQDFIVGPDGRHYRLDSEVRAVPNPKESVLVRSQVTPQVPLAQEEFDLIWPDGGDIVNFGFSTHEPTPATGDSIGQWMVPLATATVKKLMLYNVNFEGTFELCLYESNYSGEADVSGCADAAGWVGLYRDSNGEVCEEGDDCTWSPGDNECFSEPLLGAEIWPGMDIGCYSVELDGEQGWLDPIDMSSIGYAEVDEDFIIAGLATRDAGWGVGGLNQPVAPYHAFKYYWEEGSGTSGNEGWHIRTYGWMLYAIVEYSEDIPPFIDDMTVLPTTLDPDVAREVSATITDFDPTGAGNEGVASATLWYKVNDGDSIGASMTADADTFSADIPASISEAGDDIEYWITAIDNADLETEGVRVEYSIYAPTDADFVYLFDGLSGSGYPSAYYFYDAYGLCDWCEFGEGGDVWAYGEAPAELFDLYGTVFEVTTGGPVYGNAVEAKAWLDDGEKNYMLAGDEALGGYYGWPGVPVDIDTADSDANDFFAYLGVETYYGDINYGTSGDDQLPWEVSPVEDDLLSGTLYDEAASSLPDTGVILYDPYYEVGASNWLDGVDADETVTAAMTSIPRAWSGGGGDPAVYYDSTTALSVAIYKEDATLDNKVAFLTFDPLSINSDPYVWWGAHPAGPHWIAMEWFGLFDLAVGDEVAQVPSKFGLHQNYPNPFNPVTNISFDLPSNGQITLTVYNMLGQKVATLVNEVRSAGSHTVTWNGTTDAGIKVGTGVYLYQIDAGDFSATKKMILLK